MVLVDVDIAVGGDDGAGYRSGYSYQGTGYTQAFNSVYLGGTNLQISNDIDRHLIPNTITPTNTITVKTSGRGFFLFKGITIPQNSTIDDATLTIDGQLGIGDGILRVYGRKTASPTIPTGTTLFTKTVATAIGQTTLTNTVAFVTANIDVQTTIQELVNAFDYNNDNLMLIAGAPQPVLATTPISQDLQNELEVKAFESVTAIPNLTINYTFTAQSFTIDALIQALGANGSCTEVDVDPSSLLDSIDLATTDVSIATNQRIGQRVTFTSDQVAQIDQGIKTLRVWYNRVNGSKLEFEIWADATTGQGSETIVADGGGITYVGGAGTFAKQEKEFFDVPITTLTPFKPTAGVEYVIGVYLSTGSGSTRKASGGDVIQGVLTGRTSAGNWTDVAGEDFSMQLVTVTTEGQHECFTIDAQLIVAIPAQPFCINAILTSAIGTMATMFTVDAILFIRKEDFTINALLMAVQTETFDIDAVLIAPSIVPENFTVDALLFNDQRQISWIEMELPDGDPPQTCIPMSDISNAGGWEDATLGNNDTELWDELDEVNPDDDGSAVTKTSPTPTTDTFEVKLIPCTDPQSSIGHIVRMRAKGTTAGEEVKTQLFQGAVLIAESGTFTLSENYKTLDFTLSSGEADAITDYTDLRIRVVPL